MANWTNFAYFVADLGFFITIPSELFLIILTLYFIKRDYGFYKYLMIYFSLCGILFASFEFPIYPILHLKNAGFIIFSLVSTQIFSKETVTVLLATYCGIYSTAISILAVQFIYRYCAVFRTSSQHYFEQWRSILWLLYPVSLGIVWSLVVFYFASSDEYFKGYMREEVRVYYNSNIDEVGCLGMIAYFSTGSTSFITHLMPDWTYIAHSVANIGFYTTIPTELFLIVLTLFYIKRNYGCYKYLIVTFSSCGTMFASLEFLTYPILHSKDDGYFFFSLLRSELLSKEVMRVLLVVYCGVYSSTIGLLALQFLYRYWAVFKIGNLKYFKGWKLIFWLLYVLLLGVMWTLGLYYFEAPDKFFENTMRQEMLDYYHTDIKDISCMGLIAYEPNSHGVKTIRWFNSCCTLDLAFILSSQYAIILYCGIKMQLDMEKKIMVLSPSLQRLHKQMFKTLVLQITVPTFTLFLPIFFTIFIPYFDLKFSAPTGAMLCGIALYPPMDVFIVIYIVSDYRKVVLSMTKNAYQKFSSMVT